MIQILALMDGLSMGMFCTRTSTSTFKAASYESCKLAPVGPLSALQRQPPADRVHTSELAQSYRLPHFEGLRSRPEALTPISTIPSPPLPPQSLHADHSQRQKRLQPSRTQHPQRLPSLVRLHVLEYLSLLSALAIALALEH